MLTLLRKLWPLMALVLAILLTLKIALAIWMTDKPVNVVISLAGILFCFYLIYMLEGLQVAGLKIKDLDRDAIERYLVESSNVGREKVIPVYQTFAQNFDGFVTGRQIFVIMTVVTNAFLIKQINVNPENLTAETMMMMGLAEGSALANDIVTLAGILQTTVVAFATSTLITAWISQLLPQFLADRSAINFIATPGARIVLRMAMFLDKIQLGEPAKVVMGILTGSKQGHGGEHIPMGKAAFYDASINFYGRAKKDHDITIKLDATSTVTEKVSYLFKRGVTDYLDHAIHLSHPIEGDVQGKIDLPANTAAEFTAHDRKQDNHYIYWIRIFFNRGLPIEGNEYDQVDLTLQYQTKAYSTENGSQAFDYSTLLPTETARVTVIGKDRLLRQPKTRIATLDGNFGSVDSDLMMANWTATIPANDNNQATITIDHPTVGTTYHVEVEAMETMAFA